MRRMMCVFLSGILILSGCTGVHHGSFVNLDASLHQQMANDVVSRLVTMAPPAKTRFVITQPVKDVFGIRLVNTLRSKGYGISQEKTFTRSGNAMLLYYVLDMPMKNLYRLTTGFGEQKITRGYRLKNGVLEPASAWIRKE